MGVAIHRPAVVWDASATLADGPIWDEPSGSLLWIDMRVGQLHRLRPSHGDEVVLDAGEPVGFVQPRSAGGYIVGLLDSLASLDEGFTISACMPLGLAAGTQINDGACDPAGRLWFGTAARRGSQPLGGLFRCNALGIVEQMLSEIDLANGIDWSPDGRSMYFAQSGACRVDAFAFELATGELGRPRPLLELDHGMPDGLAVDTDGAVWIAVWGLGELRRYTPRGRLDAVARLPVDHVTSCAFGGHAYRTLFITTARDGLTTSALSRQPLAGSLFAIDVQTPGSPSRHSVMAA